MLRVLGQGAVVEAIEDVIPVTIWEALVDFAIAIVVDAVTYFVVVGADIRVGIVTVLAFGATRPVPISVSVATGACIPDPISIGVLLIGVGRVGAVVEAVEHCIAVSIWEALVDFAVAVVVDSIAFFFDAGMNLSLFVVAVRIHTSGALAVAVTVAVSASAGVAHTISIGIRLVGIGCVRAVVDAIQHVVGVGISIVALVNSTVAVVVDAVTNFDGCGMDGCVHVIAVITDEASRSVAVAVSIQTGAEISDAVTIGVRLIRVGYIWTIVEAVGHAIVVSILETFVDLAVAVVVDAVTDLFGVGIGVGVFVVAVGPRGAALTVAIAISVLARLVDDAIPIGVSVDVPIGIAVNVSIAVPVPVNVSIDIPVYVAVGIPITIDVAIDIAVDVPVDVAVSICVVYDIIAVATAAEMENAAYQQQAQPTRSALHGFPFAPRLDGGVASQNKMPRNYKANTSRDRCAPQFECDYETAPFVFTLTGPSVDGFEDRGVCSRRC